LNPAIIPQSSQKTSPNGVKGPYYARSWAISVVEHLHEQRARATDTVCRVLGISRRNLASFLAYRDPLWPILRDWIKNLAELEARTGKYLTDVQVSNWMYECTHRKRTKDIDERLDKRLNTLRIKEQGSREPASSPSHGAPRPAHSFHTWVQGDLFNQGVNRDLISGESAKAEGQSAEGGADA
jgi:hypothetical protein